jgi:hypothetical protein
LRRQLAELDQFDETKSIDNVNRILAQLIDTKAPLLVNEMRRLRLNYTKQLIDADRSELNAHYNRGLALLRSIDIASGQLKADDQLMREYIWMLEQLYSQLMSIKDHNDSELLWQTMTTDFNRLLKLIDNGYDYSDRIQLEIIWRYLSLCYYWHCVVDTDTLNSMKQLTDRLANQCYSRLMRFAGGKNDKKVKTDELVHILQWIDDLYRTIRSQM